MRQAGYVCITWYTDAIQTLVYLYHPIVSNVPEEFKILAVTKNFFNLTNLRIHATLQIQQIMCNFKKIYKLKNIDRFILRMIQCVHVWHVYVIEGKFSRSNPLVEAAFVC